MVQKAREHIDLVTKEREHYRSILKRVSELVKRLNVVVERPVLPIPEIHYSFDYAQQVPKNSKYKCFYCDFNNLASLSQ